MTEGFQEQEEPRKAVLVDVRNRLKEKVGTGGFGQEALAKAQLVLELNSVDFIPLVAELVDILGVDIEKAKSGLAGEGEILDDMLYTMVQLKSQSAMFNYPILENISDILVRFLNAVHTLDAAVLDIVAAYRQSVGLVMSDKILGLGENNIGEKLGGALTDACERYYHQKSRMTEMQGDL
jgi:hypothetical protein